MENTFTINGKRCRVTLDRTGLTWCLLGSSTGKFRVPAPEILSCWACPKGALKCCPSQDAPTETWAQNEGFPRNDGDSKLSTISSASSSLTEDNSGRYGATEECNESPCDGNSAVSADHQSSSRPPPPSTTPDVQSEKFNEGLRGDHKDRPTGLPFKHCIHSRKSNGTPALAVEICERVLPSRLQRSCFRGDGEVMVTTWKPRVLLLQHESLDTVRSWLQVLWEVVAGSPSRPRHLLVIVNPVSGSKEAQKIYQSRVAPLLQRAAIRVTLKKTMHSGHVEELAAQAVVEGEVDGVVTVGGDGTASEVTAGLLKATARQLGVTIDDRNTPLPKSSVVLGFIPGGSTNSYVVSCHGTEDTTTSVLQIIMGTCRDVHLGGMYVQDKLVDVVLMNSYAGYLAGLMEKSNRLRCLGPHRYIVSAFNEFFALRSFKCEIRYLAEENVHDLLQFDAPPCHALCLACQAPSPHANTSQRKGKWVELKGEYDFAMISLVTCESKFTKHGVSPMCHVNNGYCDVLLSPTTSKLRFFLRSIRATSTRDYITKGVVQAFRTSELHWRFPTQSKPLGCDGELRYHQEFVLRVHRGCLPVYSRGREPLSTLDSSALSNNFT